MNLEEQRLFEFLRGIQLEQFHGKLNSVLHVTQLSHFDYVKEEDLTNIGMSRPDLRRLFDHLKRMKRKSNTLFSKLRRSIRREPSTDIQIAQDVSGSQITIYTDPNLISGFQTPASPTIRTSIDVRQGLKCLIHERELQLDGFLGRGAFGYVRKGVWTTDNGKFEVAVKCLKSTQDAALVQVQNEFIKEANAMSKLDHPHLIRLYGIVLASPMMLVTELAHLGSLLGRLRSEPEKFLISTLCSIVVQIACGMKYLEENRFVHRDLAARNILLMSYEKIKIGDFGLMRALPTDMDYYIMQPNGLVPYAWCAPECLQYRKFSHASDVWAFGVTVIEIFSYGSEPWPGLNGAQILEKIKEPHCCRPDQPNHCPSGFYKIIRDVCWDNDPDKRGTFSEIEKRLLASLPTEVLAASDYSVAHGDALQFSKGDTITLFELSENRSLWKGQNRMTGNVGFLPVDLFPNVYQDEGKGHEDKYPILPPPPCDYPEPVIPERREVRSKSTLLNRISRSGSRRIEDLQQSRRVTGSFGEFDSASLSSGSSSGSNETDSYNRLPSAHRTAPVHIKGLVTTAHYSSSSGYSSGVPSLENSFRDELCDARKGSFGDSVSRRPSVFEDASLSCSSRSDSFSSRMSAGECRSSLQSEGLYQNVTLPREFSPQRSAPIVIPSAQAIPQMAGSPNSISKVPIIIPSMGSHCFSPQSQDDFRGQQECQCPRHLVRDFPAPAQGIPTFSISGNCTLPRSAPTTELEKEVLRNCQRRSQLPVKEDVVLKNRVEANDGNGWGLDSTDGTSGVATYSELPSTGSPYEQMHVGAFLERQGSTNYEKMKEHPVCIVAHARTSDGLPSLPSASAASSSAPHEDARLYENVGPTMASENLLPESPPALPPKVENKREMEPSKADYNDAPSPEADVQRKTSESDRSRKTRSRIFADDTTLFGPQPPFPRKCFQRSRSMRTTYENVNASHSEIDASRGARCMPLLSFSAPTSHFEDTLRIVRPPSPQHASGMENSAQQVMGASRAVGRTQSEIVGKVTPCESVLATAEALYCNTPLSTSNVYSEVKLSCKEDNPPPLPVKRSQERELFSHAVRSVSETLFTHDSGAVQRPLATAKESRQEITPFNDFSSGSGLEGELLVPAHSKTTAPEPNAPLNRSQRLRACSSPQLSLRAELHQEAVSRETPIPPPRKNRKDSKRRPQSLHASAVAVTLQQCIIIDIPGSTPGQAPYDVAAGRESIVAKLKAQAPVEVDKSGPPVPPRKVKAARSDSLPAEIGESSSSPKSSIDPVSRPSLGCAVTASSSHSSPSLNLWYPCFVQSNGMEGEIDRSGPNTLISLENLAVKEPVVRDEHNNANSSVCFSADLKESPFGVLERQKALLLSEESGSATTVASSADSSSLLLCGKEEQQDGESIEGDKIKLTSYRETNELSVLETKRNERSSPEGSESAWTYDGIEVLVSGLLRSSPKDGDVHDKEKPQLVVNFETSV